MSSENLRKWADPRTPNTTAVLLPRDVKIASAAAAAGTSRCAVPRDEDTATLPRTARRRGPKKVRRAVGKVRRGVLRLGDIEGEGSGH